MTTENFPEKDADSKVKDSSDIRENNVRLRRERWKRCAGYYADAIKESKDPAIRHTWSPVKQILRIY